MISFKVICTTSDGWKFTEDAVITKSSFFGLLKKTTTSKRYVEGPTKDEVCTVIGEEDKSNGLHYVLRGYNKGCYIAKYFVPISEIGHEFKETEFKKIVKSVPACDN